MRKGDNLEVLMQRVETKARHMGALYFGAVDLRPVAGFVVEQGGEWLRQFPFAITGAVPIPDAWVDALPQQNDPRVMQSYTELLRIIDDRWLNIEYELAFILQSSGYKALPIAEHATDRNKWVGVFSHKLAAHLAGFGWIGKNNLLTTPERGPRLRLLTVLTTAPLNPTKPNVGLNYDGCGTCQLCVDICPAKALTGMPFTPDIPRDARLNVNECWNYREQQLKRTGSPTCGLCLQICPFRAGSGKVVRGSEFGRNGVGGSSLSMIYW